VISLARYPRRNKILRCARNQGDIIKIPPALAAPRKTLSSPLPLNPAGHAEVIRGSRLERGGRARDGYATVLAATVRKRPFLAQLPTVL